MIKSLPDNGEKIRIKIREFHKEIGLREAQEKEFVEAFDKSMRIEESKENEDSNSKEKERDAKGKGHQITETNVLLIHFFLLL